MVKSLGPKSDTGGHTGKSQWFVKAFNRQVYFDQYSTELGQKRTSGEVDFIERAATLAKSHKILDVACGHGRHVNELSRRGHNVTGIDIAPNAIEIAKKEAKKLGINPTYTVGDIRKLPYKNAEFDRVYSVFTSFGYFKKTEDEQTLLREIARVLKPGGIFLIDVLSLESEQIKFAKYGQTDQAAKEWLVIPTKKQILSGEERQITQWFNPKSHWLHTKREWMEKDEPAMHESFIHLFSKDELEEMLRRAGMTPNLTVGNYDGSPHNTNNTRTIIIATKEK